MKLYIEQILRYKLPNDDKYYLIKQSSNLFTLLSIKNERTVHSFLKSITNYKANSVNLMLKVIENKTTTNKRDKKQKALSGAENIIDYLGGVYSDNENAKELKNLLRDFINNTNDFEVTKVTHNITKDELRNDLRKLFKNKSAEIDDFVKGLENYKL